MKKIFTTCSLLMVVLALNAQITFENKYNIFNDAYSDLVFSQQDGYLMAMVSRNNRYYLTLVKTNLYGDTLWTKTYDVDIEGQPDLGGTSDEMGNIYITIHEFNKKVVKFDSNGNLLWAKNYSTSKKEMVVKDNTLWVCGDTYNGNYLFKINATTGDSIWRSPVFNQKDWASLSYCSSIAITEDNEIIVTVSNQDNNWHMHPSQFFILNENGNQLVNFTLNWPDDYFVADTKCVNNEIISIASDNLNYDLTYFLRYTSDGTILAFKEQHFACQYMGLIKMLVTGEDQIVAMGYLLKENSFDVSVFLHCYSMNGDSLWSTTNGKNLKPYDIKTTTDEGFIITGGYEGNGAKNHPFLIKTNSMGALTSMPEKTNTLQVVAYPNPATDAVMFAMPGLNEGKLSIYNSTGQLCFETMIKSEKTVWNTDGCNAGLYFYSIRTATETSCGSVVLE